MKQVKEQDIPFLAVHGDRLVNISPVARDGAIGTAYPVEIDALSLLIINPQLAQEFKDSHESIHWDRIRKTLPE
jgi:hypothetical protein